jgi:hypothetical protein
MTPAQRAALEYVEHREQPGGPHLRALRSLAKLGYVVAERDKYRTYWHITVEGKGALAS